MFSLSHVAMALIVVTGQRVFPMDDCSQGDPQPGLCHNNNDPNPTGDIIVYPLETGSCSFQNTLCAYTQGCYDLDGLQWTKHADHVQAGKSGCANAYSVLKSAWLSGTGVFCIDMYYQILIPARLEMFYFTSSGRAEPLFKESSTQFPVSQTKLSFTVSDVGKLLFRAYGGGGGAGIVKIYNLTIDNGHCEKPACMFKDNVFCGGSSSNWELKNELTQPIIVKIRTGIGFFPHVNIPDVPAVLETNLSRATKSRTDCMQVYYIVTGLGSSLNVSLHYADGSIDLLWTFVSHNATLSGDWQDAKIPIKSSQAFTILMEGKISSGIVALDVPAYFYSEDLSCQLHPETATPPKEPTAGSTLTTHNLATTTTSTTELTVNKAKAEWSRGSDGVPVPVIAGSVAGVAGVVIVIVVVGVVVWRERRAGATSKQESLEGELGRNNANMADGKSSVQDLSDPTPHERESSTTAGGYDIVDGSRTNVQYEQVGRPDPPSDYSSLQNSPSYYNVAQDTNSTQHKTMGQYEHPGQPSPPSEYSALHGNVWDSQNSSSYYNVAQNRNSSHHNMSQKPADHTKTNIYEEVKN